MNGDLYSQHRQRNRVVVGAVIIGVGVFALLDNLGWFDIRFVKELWPLIFVLAGALKLQQTRRAPGGFIVGAALIVVGIAMTMDNLDWMHFQVRQWWPVLMIIGGIHLMSRDASRRRDAEGRVVEGDAGGDKLLFGGVRRDEHGSRIDTSVVLSGCTLKSDSPDFQGGEVTAVLGGAELDLRRASISQGEAVLHVFAMWGGIVIKVPADWSVIVNGMPILGGIEDKSVPPMTQTKRLVIDGYVIMGGIEIKN